MVARTLAVLLATLLAGPAASAQTGPVAHTRAPPLVGGISPGQIAALADGGIAIEADRPPGWALAEHRRLATALATLKPQRPGQVDSYVVAVALDSDPVFVREAREAARVLARRYGAEGRTIVLAGADGNAGAALPMGSPGNLDAALARVAELADAHEDVLILYLTSHGAPFGIVYYDGDQGFGAISPRRLWQSLSTFGLNNRLVLVSACFAGGFVPLLASDTSIVVTAAAADRTSFGCQANNDWTFFGDALINHALRQPQPLAAAVEQSKATIAGWEARAKVKPSAPQSSFGAGAARWLSALEQRLPPATRPVGKPTTATLDEIARPTKR